MVPFHNSNPTTKLWKKLGLNTNFNHHLSKWIKFMNLYACVWFWVLRRMNGCSPTLPSLITSFGIY
jgi:hypothetical protein